MHEVYSAMGFGRRQWYLYAVAVPYTMLIMLSSSAAVRALVLPASFLVVLYYNICLIARHQTLDFTKLAGFVYFSGVILFCFYSLVHLKRTLPTGTYGYDAVYFILLILCFAWGGDTMAYFTGRAFGRRKLAPLVSPHKTVEGAAGGIAGSMAAGVLVTFVYSVLDARFPLLTITITPAALSRCSGLRRGGLGASASLGICLHRLSSVRPVSRTMARSSPATAASLTALTA